MSIIRKRLHILEVILKEKLPNIKVGFYLSRKKSFLHMGLDQSLILLGDARNLTKKYTSFFLLAWKSQISN